MNIDMNLLKKLREITFAPFKDCKDALVEANGDIDKAQEILREKGVLKAGKKIDRETNEGIVKVLKAGNKIAGVKLLCETDFVAKNEGFQELCDSLLNKLLAQSELFDSRAEASSELLENLDNMVKEAVGTIGENMQLADVVVSTNNGYVYNHPGNKVASIVFFEGEGDEIAKELALQITAMNPNYLDIDSVPRDIVDSLESKFRAELLESGKPENVVEQILKGKLSKALSEDVLLEQEYIRDGSKKVKNILPAGFNIKSYIRLSVK